MKKIFLLSASLMFAAQAASAQNNDTTVIVPAVQIEMPENTPDQQTRKLTADDLFSRDFEPRVEPIEIQRFETQSETQLQYDVSDDMDLNLGVLKDDVIETPYGFRPATQPQGKYVEPIDSKVGAGLSTKF